MSTVMLGSFLVLTTILSVIALKKDICNPAVASPSPNFHILPEPNSKVSTVAFGSCFVPSYQTNDLLWKHVRDGNPDLWVWLGDNMYADGNDLNSKRVAYNEARNDPFYSTVGPLGSPKIPTIGTWDDHDFGSDNDGDNYPCLLASQSEYITHFNIPASDPRHPSQGVQQQRGVYSSMMFSQPNGEPGIHLILLDGRTDRSPTYATHGRCEGADSHMLSDTQWAWLDKELAKPAALTIIGSGVQVLPPTDQSNHRLSTYCSYDGANGTFDAAIAAVGESASHQGTRYESWAEIPQDRAKLLGKAQAAINAGTTKKVIFLSGDQHWAEMMVKRMPQSEAYGAEQTLYEVTASGIDQDYVEDIYNSNRLRERSADTAGSGLYDQECDFPFTYKNVTYGDCTTFESATGAPWCSTKVDTNGDHVSGHWGYCLPIQSELKQNTTFSGSNTCTGMKHHVCSSRNNYGTISVDWEQEKVTMSIWTPTEAPANVLASSHTISLKN